MKKRTLIWIFAGAAVILAVTSIFSLRFASEFSRNSIDPDLIEGYWVIFGFALLLVSLLCIGGAIIIQLLKESET